MFQIKHVTGPSFLLSHLGAQQLPTTYCTSSPYNNVYSTFYPFPLRILPFITCPLYRTERSLSALMLSKFTSVPGNSSATHHTTFYSSRHLLSKIPSRQIIFQVNQPHRNNKPFSKYTLFTIQVTNRFFSNLINSQSNSY